MSRSLGLTRLDQAYHPLRETPNTRHITAIGWVTFCASISA